MSRPRPRSESRRPESRRSKRPTEPRDSDLENEEAERAPLAPRPAEQILINALPDLLPGRILCTSLGRGQFAIAAAQANSDSQVCCSFLDQYALEQTRLRQTEFPANLRLECAAEFPEDPFDAVAIPTSTSGEAELVRDRLQAGHERLRDGGTMLAATDNSIDTWLHAEMRKLFAKVTRRATEQGTLFKATKTEPLKKVKNFECALAFRDEGRLIHAVSRPGVFSHRQVDGGAGLAAGSHDRGGAVRFGTRLRIGRRLPGGGPPRSRRARARRRLKPAGRRVHRAGRSNSTGFPISTCG